MDMVTILGKAFFNLLLSLPSLKKTIFTVVLVDKFQNLLSPCAHGTLHVLNFWYLHICHYLFHSLPFHRINVFLAERDLLLGISFKSDKLCVFTFIRGTCFLGSTGEVSEGMSDSGML